MQSIRKVSILPQPNDVSCGPTCLKAIYDYYNDEINLNDLISDIAQVSGGGTLAVMLGNHALERGYNVTIYTYNLQVFDPTWFTAPVDLALKLTEQRMVKPSKKLKQATKEYLMFLHGGGRILFQELRPALLQNILLAETPILTGLSATYLYKTAREISAYNVPHDTKGEPVGHFVVLSNYDEEDRKVMIADPYVHNPSASLYYKVDIQPLINSILLGIVTYDANLLVIKPKQHA